jgi:5-methyltetrahydropteroyltriglutamate--homocysteine methyltransferase
MTKWFDTNYHYIVPEFEKGQKFRLASTKPVDAYKEALAEGVDTRPVLVGPITFLMLGKDKGGGHPLDHLDALLEVYGEVLRQLAAAGATRVQLDEPLLVTDLDERAKAAYASAYAKLREASALKLFVTTPFGRLDDNLQTALRLPIDALHIDLVRGEGQLDEVLAALPSSSKPCARVVDGRNHMAE